MILFLVWSLDTSTSGYTKLLRRSPAQLVRVWQKTHLWAYPNEPYPIRTLNHIYWLCPFEERSRIAHCAGSPDSVSRWRMSIVSHRMSTSIYYGRNPPFYVFKEWKWRVVEYEDAETYLIAGRCRGWLDVIHWGSNNHLASSRRSVALHVTGLHTWWKRWRNQNVISFSLELLDRCCLLGVLRLVSLFEFDC